MLVQTDQAFAGLDALFDAPASACHLTSMASGTGRGLQQR
jgi:hypothetical protein